MTHEPVLLERVIGLLSGEGAGEKGKIVDCTLGLGGYSEKILETFPDARVYGLDRDPRAVGAAEARLQVYASRFRAWRANFGGMEEILSSCSPFSAFVFDLGVSNMQLTEAERGFSFQSDGPLDMRMDPDDPRGGAAEILNSLSEAELAEIFWLYGEERHSRRIASGIGEYRRKKGFLRTTGELVGIIRDVLPAPVQRKMGTHPARRVFQALRIYVNDELGELEAGLTSALRLLSPGGLVIAVSYHSLEDRAVKHTFRSWEKEGRQGTVLTKRPVLPEPGEVEKNFRARSAKLRAFRFSPQAFRGKTRRTKNVAGENHEK
jgi:16S rRNA (cytosine1402-N4)-methyltransferase